MKQLDDDDIEFAKELYKIFYSRYAESNPTDLNTITKYRYAMEIGFNGLSVMQSARKLNTKNNGFPHPWTKRSYWKGELF